MCVHEKSNKGGYVPGERSKRVEEKEVEWFGSYLFHNVLIRVVIFWKSLCQTYQP